MRKFANLLQILLLTNGLLSLLESQVSCGLPAILLAALYNYFSSFIVILAILFFPCLGFNRNLPKWIFLPQIFLLFWDITGLWPLPSSFNQFQTHMLVAVGQVLLGALALFYNRTQNHKSLLLLPETFSSPGSSFGNFLRFAVGSLLLLPVCLLFFGFSLSHSYVERLSGGFVRLGLDGLYMKERTYNLEDKTIRLASMIHIGDQEYYDDLAQSISAGRTLVLSEGVSDQDGLLRQRFSYGGVADLLGLSAQEAMALEGRLIDIEQLEQADFMGTEKGLPDIVPADVDLRDFDPQTLAFINALGDNLLNNSSFVDGFKAFNLWAQENVTPETNNIIMNDLVTKRNRALVGHLAAALKKYDTIVIPWGALHMIGIEEAVIAQGFLLQGSSERRSINFSKIPYAEMFEQLVTTEDQR